MSKKSNKKQLNTQLDDLFDDLDDGSSLGSLESQTKPQGWLWEIDQDANYTVCSPEVQTLLGFKPEDLIGRSFITFSVNPPDQDKLKRVVKRKTYPAQVELILLTASQVSVPAIIHVEQKLDESDQPIGWRGVTQLQKTVDAAALIPEAAQPELRPDPVPVSEPELELETDPPAEALVKESSVESAALPQATEEAEVKADPVVPEVALGEPTDVKQTTQKTEPLDSPPISKPTSDPALTRAPIEEHGVMLDQDIDQLAYAVAEKPFSELDEDEQVLVQEIHTQLGLALENANLFRQTQAALTETDILYQASAYINRANSYAEVLEAVAQYTLAPQNVQLFAINLFNTPWSDETPPDWIDVAERLTPNSETQNLKGRYKITEAEHIIERLKSDSHFFIPDMKEEILVDPNSTLGKYLQTGQSAIFLPISVSDQWLGFIDIFFGIKVKPTEADFRRLEALASQASQKIISINLNAQQRERRNVAASLNDLARVMTELTTEQELTDLIATTLFNRYQPDQLSRYQWDLSTNGLRLVHRQLARPDHAEDHYELGDTVNMETSPIIAEAFQQNKLVYIAEDWQEDFLREHMCVPIEIAGEISGLVEVYHTARNAAISEGDQEFASGLIQLASGAIERARLFEQTQNALTFADEQARRLAELNNLSEHLADATSPQEIYDITAKHIPDIIQLDQASIAILDQDQKAFNVFSLEERGAMQTDNWVPYENTLLGTALNENRIIIDPNLPQSKYTDAITLAESGLTAMMSAPLFSGAKPIGTLNVGRTKKHPFQDTDENLLLSVASLISATVENRGLFQEVQTALSLTEEQARRLRLLNEMSEQITQLTNEDAMFLIGVDKVCEILQADRVSLGLLTEDGKYRLTTVQSEIEEAGEPVGDIIEVTGAVAQAIETQNVVIGSAESPIGEMRATLVAPLIVSGEIIGTINAAKYKENPFGVEEENVMQQAASLLSGVVQNTRLFNTIQKRNLQLETSAEVSRVASTILDTNELLKQVVDLIQTGFRLYYVGLFLVDQTGDWTSEPGRWAVLRAGTGEAGRQMLLNNHKLELGGDSMIGTAIANQEARIALDVGVEARFFRNPYLPNTRSEMALPLRSRGSVIGAISIQSQDEAAFTPEDITALQTMADQLSNAIDNASLFEQTEQRAEELAVLNEMARAFTQASDVDTVINYCYEFASRLIDTTNYFVALIDPITNEFELRLVIRDHKRISFQLPTRAETKERGIGPTEWIADNRQPLLFEENAYEGFQQMGLDASRGTPPASWLGVPMLRGDNAIGVMGVQSFDTPKAFNPHDLDILSAIANQASIAVDNARRFQQIQAQARREQLMREITTRVHSTSDADTILRTAVREISSALGRRAYIELSGEGKQSTEMLSMGQDSSTNEAQSNGNGTENSSHGHNETLEETEESAE